MPTEFRRITFGVDDLIEAIVDYDKYGLQKFTCGCIVDVHIEDDPIISVLIELKVFEQTKTVRIKQTAKEVGAALVMYCLNNNIPVPTKAVRYLKKTGDKLALYLSLDEAIEGPATILPDFFDYDVQPQAVQAA